MGGKRVRGRPRQRANPLSSCSVQACVLFAISFLVVEFCFIHQHEPAPPDGRRTKLHEPSPEVPSVLSYGGADVHDPAAIPGAPSVPDSMKGGAPVPGHDRTDSKKQWQRPPSASGGAAIDVEDGAGFRLPPRQPLDFDVRDAEGSASSDDDESGGLGEQDKGYGEMRVAVLIPYSGPGLPIWFDAFTDLAAANKDLVDWIIFCAEDLAQVKTPPNVRMISTSPSELAWMLAGVVYPSDADENPDVYVSDFQTAVRGRTLLTELQIKARNARAMAARFIQTLLSKNPYYMVEFKPALGWVLREYLKDYTHWAYGDLDVFFGDLTKGWLEPSEMRDYDVITYSFGDQQRAYLRGQLTVHKNIPKVNQIWRSCEHLSNYLKRIERTIETKRYNLESAEGCYSMALMYSKDIKAKYAVKVFTDMPGGKQGDEEEVVITGDALIKRCPQQEQRRGDVVEPDYGGRMQVDVGELSPVQMNKGYFCEYWINPRFQTCLKLENSESKNIFLIEGQYYERDYVNLWQEKVEGSCSMGAFHHFQEFKGNYRAWNTRPPMPPVHRGMVAGDGGLVPLPNGEWHAMALDLNAPPPANRDRFTHRYCLQWSISYEGGVSDAKFSCDISLTPRGLATLHDSRPERARSGSLSGGTAVTLGGVGGSSDVPRLLRSCRDWKGPKVLVLMLRESQQEEAAAAIRAEDEIEGLDNAYIVSFIVPDIEDAEEGNGDILPTKALLNAVSDLCQTRHLLTLPSGYRISRGTEEEVVAALETPTETPRVLFIPQWCVDPADPHEVGESSSLDLDDLARKAAGGKAGLCLSHSATSPSIFLGSAITDIAVKDVLEGWREPGGLRGAVAKQDSDLSPVKTRNGLALLRSDAVSPVMVVDLWSAPALFLRHIEETCQSGCFDGAYARGLWAAGFSFEVLPGAAAFSESLPPASEVCRAGVVAQMAAYSRFLQDVRRVYSKEKAHLSDLFKPGIRPSAEAQARSRRKRTSGAHPFRRPPDAEVANS